MASGATSTGTADPFNYWCNVGVLDVLVMVELLTIVPLTKYINFSVMNILNGWIASPHIRGIQNKNTANDFHCGD